MSFGRRGGAIRCADVKIVVVKVDLVQRQTMAPQIIDQMIVQRHPQHGNVGICRAISILNQAVEVIIGIERITTLVIPRGERRFQLTA